MYPLNVILVHCGESIRNQVRREFGNQLAWVKCEYRNAIAVVEQKTELEKEKGLLFVVHVRAMADMEELQRLSKAFPNQPILVLHERQSDQPLFLSALRAGAAFAIPVPLEAEELRTALDWIVRQFGYAMRETKLIAVAGITGGCGATSIALNLAHEISATYDHPCLLLELAFRMGMVATYLHLEPGYSIHQLLEQVDNLDIDFLKQVLTPVGDHLSVLCGPQQAIHSPSVDPSAVQRVLFYARALADVIVVDVPCTYDDLYFDTLAHADQVVLVWEQTLPSVRALQMVRDALNLRRLEATQQTMVINRYDARVQGFSAADLQKLLQLPSVHTVANDWPAMSEAVNNGRPLRVQAPKSRVVSDINALAALLVQAPPVDTAASQTANTGRGLFGRLVRRFGLNS